MKQSSPVHAFTDAALGDRDGVGVADAIRTGEVGAGAVLEAAIECVERVNPHLDAVQLRCYERAHSQPTAAGPFAGVPTFVKDNTDIAGLPTCHGSAAFTPHPARRDYPTARQFLGRGFAPLGKSTLPEYGLTASTEYADRPPTRNRGPMTPETYRASLASGRWAEIVGDRAYSCPSLSSHRALAGAGGPDDRLLDPVHGQRRSERPRESAMATGFHRE